MRVIITVANEIQANLVVDVINEAEEGGELDFPFDTQIDFSMMSQPKEDD
jgi:hypothetical protein